jgi:putative nucleotidyltransferase with HDIG domain
MSLISDDFLLKYACAKLVSQMSVCQEIVDLFTSGGADAYHGEAVTQLQHALPSADAAHKSGASEEEIAAALLHDIGHMLDPASAGGYGIVDHDRLGALWLRDYGFSDRIARLADGHVDAKRYLVATNAAYCSRLSPASQATLLLQGGPMTKPLHLKRIRSLPQCSVSAHGMKPPKIPAPIHVLSQRGSLCCNGS